MGLGVYAYYNRGPKEGAADEVYRIEDDVHDEVGSVFAINDPWWA